MVIGNLGSECGRFGGGRKTVGGVSRVLTCTCSVSEVCHLYWLERQNIETTEHRYGI